MTFLFLALAVWRTAALLVKEAGPFMLFHRLRVRAGLMYDRNYELILIPETFFAQILSCVWCATMWTGLGWTLLYILAPDIAFYISMPFALSAAAILLDRLLR